MRTQAPRLPAGLEAATRDALQAGDGPRAEAALATLFAALARDLATEAEGKVGDAAAPLDARRAAGTRFLEAIWRYWNLIDFIVSQRDPKAALAIRLAFDAAESASRATSPTVAENRGTGATPPRPAPPPSAGDPGALRAPLAQLGKTLTGVVETLATATTRRNS
jgi:hypothetical protein